MSQKTGLVQTPVGKIAIRVLIILMRTYSWVMLWVHALRQFL